MATSPVRRRFNLGDLVIVVGAAAGFFGLVRRFWLDPTPDGWTFATPYSVVTSGNRARTWFEMMGTGWVVATFALLVLRARGPRPRWRRLMRQPGWVACFAAALACVVSLGYFQAQSFAASLAIPALGGDAIVRDDVRFTISPPGTGLVGGLAVLVAWVLLRADGRWAAERSWVDRSGRVIGVGWLFLPAGNLYLHLTSLLVDLY